MKVIRSKTVLKALFNQIMLFPAIFMITDSGGHQKRFSVNPELEIQLPGLHPAAHIDGEMEPLVV
jgi:hypothetical protein